MAHSFSTIAVLFCRVVQHISTIMDELYNLLYSHYNVTLYSVQYTVQYTLYSVAYTLYVTYMYEYEVLYITVMH